MSKWAFEDLGRSSYKKTWDRQLEIHEDVRNGVRPPTVIFVEHDPVITLGRRPESEQNITASAPLLSRQGVEVVRSDRGGDVTYHGPGQLVAYPIVPLNNFAINTKRYVWRVEQAVIDTLAAFEINAHRDACAVGVWVGGSPINNEPCDSNGQCDATAESPADAMTGGAKIAAIGVRVRRWVTLHGLALNVDPDMSHFNLIVPCGLAGRPVTSMKLELGDDCPTIAQVKNQLATCLPALFE